MPEPRTYDCVVIGGGPAGLSMGYQLSRREGIEYTVLERGGLGHSWAQMHDSLRLLSPMWVNQLPGHRYSVFRSLSKIPKGDFIQYLKSFAARYSINSIPNTNVIEVLRQDGGFVIKTEQGEFCARAVVNATGYYAAPYTPKFKDNDASVPLIHSADYKSPEQLAEMIGAGRKSILIVGKRVSAGQLLEELDDTGYALGISIRAPIETRIGGWLGIAKENAYYIKEKLRFAFDPYIKENSRALMDGGKTDEIIASGRLRQHATIQSIKDGEVTFSDGQKSRYDLIICATGFLTEYPHLRHLIDAEEPLLSQLEMSAHKTTPGLFFLGVDNLVNFKSRYVRGVASDSAVVSGKLAQYLNPNPQPVT